MAIIRPPLELLDRLERVLNDGALRVAHELARRLDDDWTVCVRPRLGQDVPDLVAVHDTFGVCATESTRCRGDVVLGVRTNGRVG